MQNGDTITTEDGGVFKLMGKRGGIMFFELQQERKAPRRTITMPEALMYEVESSWWASRVSWRWLQSLAGRYFAWKVRRKWGRYILGRKRMEQITKEYL